MQPPFKTGDLVSIIPLSDHCGIEPAYLYKTVEILSCRTSTFDDGYFVINIGKWADPYHLIYPDVDFKIVFSDPLRDEVI